MRSEGRSPTTIRRYDGLITQYLRRAARTGWLYPWPPSAEHVGDYLAGLRDDGMARNTVRNAHVALRAWFNWLSAEGEVSENPCLRLKTPKMEDVSPDPYTDDEVRAMLAACRGRDFMAARDAAIVGVLADTGLRASEFCGLEMEDVELDSERIRIVGKGGRHRFVGLGVAAQALLLAAGRRQMLRGLAKVSRRPNSQKKIIRMIVP